MSAISFLGNKDSEEALVQALAQNLSEEQIEKSAEAKKTNELLSVIEVLDKCASNLEEVGHPSSKKVNEVLSFIDSTFFKHAE